MHKNQESMNYSVYNLKRYFAPLHNLALRLKILSTFLTIPLDGKVRNFRFIR